MNNVNVPLLDLKAQYQSLEKDIMAAVTEVIRSQNFILGPEVTNMEKEIADYSQAKECLGVSSGSDALLLALMGLEIGPGDEVITSPYTFFATGGAVARVGATPVYVDVDPASYNIDPAKIEAKITKRTRAIIPVHLYGQCAEMDPILDIAKRHGLHVIEDAAQAIGSEYKGRRAGSMGTIGCFSFFPSKNLGAFGDGGAITTNDPELAERMRCLRVHGSKPKYYHKWIGGNFRLDALQAAVIRVKLKKLDEWTAARQKNAAWYTQQLRDRGLAGVVVSPPAVVQNRHIFNQYVVRVADRANLIAHLKSAQVGCEIYYPVPLHLQECFAYLNYKAGDMPVSEQAAAETLALPIYPELIQPQLNHVVDSLYGFYQSTGKLNKKRAA